MTSKPRVMPFQWIPGRGSDLNALLRLEQRFPRPKMAMGGAWVMSGERQYFEAFRDRSVAVIETAEIDEILWEITSATSSFGRQREWVQWFLYLLPRASRRAFEPTRGSSFLIESIVSAFVAHFPERIEDEYRGFRQDIFATVGPAIMGSDLWTRGRIRLGDILCKAPEASGQPWGWYAPSADLSASIFFCLKYLEPEALDPWVRSWMSIEDPHWRAQLLAFLIAFYRMLDAGWQQPAEFQGLQPTPSWTASRCLTGSYSESGSESIPFLSGASIRKFLDLLEQSFGEDLVLSWAASFDDAANLEMESYALADDFLSLHSQER